MPATNPAPRIASGVEQLNSTLNDVRQRISALSTRIGDIANQFGAHSIDEAAVASPITKTPESTNDWMNEIGIALSNLERITSRIDNQ